jgi:hypothetical protein
MRFDCRHFALKFGWEYNADSGIVELERKKRMDAATDKVYHKKHLTADIVVLVI